VVVDYVTRAAGATEDRKRLRNEIRQCEFFLKRLKDGIDDADEGQMWSETIKALEGEGAPLHQLRVALAIVKVKLQEPKRGFKKHITVLKSPLDGKDVEKIISTIERQKTLLELALANDLPVCVVAVSFSSPCPTLKRLYYAQFQGCYASKCRLTPTFV
jgi:hypothetical protein